MPDRSFSNSALSARSSAVRQKLLATPRKEPDVPSPLGELPCDWLRADAGAPPCPAAAPTLCPAERPPPADPAWPAPPCEPPRPPPPCEAPWPPPPCPLPRASAAVPTAMPASIVTSSRTVLALLAAFIVAPSMKDQRHRMRRPYAVRLSSTFPPTCRALTLNLIAAYSPAVQGC